MPATQKCQMHEHASRFVAPSDYAGIWCASKWRRLPGERRHAILQLANLDDLILRDVGEVLARVADRPEHLEVHDARRLAETDVLLQR